MSFCSVFLLFTVHPSWSLSSAGLLAGKVTVVVGVGEVLLEELEEGQSCWRKWKWGRGQSCWRRWKWGQSCWRRWWWQSCGGGGGDSLAGGSGSGGSPAGGVGSGGSLAGWGGGGSFAGGEGSLAGRGTWVISRQLGFLYLYCLPKSPFNLFIIDSLIFLQYPLIHYVW